MGETASTLRAGRPLWLPARLDDRQPEYSSLAGARDADVVIIGGGITGALTALRFAEAGVEAVVLEADRVGRGSTAASSALLLQRAGPRPGRAGRRYGPARARRIWACSADAARDLQRILAAHDVRCDLGRRDTIFYTTDADAVATLHAEYASRVRAGIAAKWLGPRALRTDAGIPARAAIRTRGNAQCDPYRACVGLMRAAARAGAAIFERSPARRITPTRHGVRVATPRGTIEARQVVIATGYATRDFKPLAGRFALTYTYVLATPPLGARDRREIGLADVMLWDTRRPYHYARWTADHRLILGGGDTPTAGGRAPAARIAVAERDVRAHMERLLPGLARIAIAHAWEGRFAETPDTPALRRRAPPLPAARLRARLRRQRHDVRRARGPPAPRAVARRDRRRSRALRLRPAALTPGRSRRRPSRGPVEEPRQGPGVDDAIGRHAGQPRVRERDLDVVATALQRARRCRARTGSRTAAPRAPASQSRSCRAGSPSISIATPLAAAAANTRGQSAATPGRALYMRPRGCPRTWTAGRADRGQHPLRLSAPSIAGPSAARRPRGRSRGARRRSTSMAPSARMFASTPASSRNPPPPSRFRRSISTRWRRSAPATARWRSAIRPSDR